MTTKELFIAQWQNECNCTLNAIKALPDDSGKWDYRHHPKARSPRDIMEHILPHAASLATAADTLVIREEAKKFASKDEMASFFKGQVDLLVSKLKAMDDTKWETANVDFIINEYKTITLPMFQMFWIFMFDVIHHRGQLSTMYRAMGARNPNIYGPSAEDIEEMMAAMAAGKN